MSKSVVMISPGFYPVLGGAERQALELSKALQGLGLEVRVLTRSLAGQPPGAVVDGVAVLRLPAWGSGLANALVFMVSCFLWLLRHAREYQVVHVHLAGSPAVAAALAGRLLRKRVLVKLGGGRGIGEIAASRRTRAGRLKLRALALLRPRFVAVAGELVSELREGLGRAPVVVVPNGVDLRRFAPGVPERREELREALRWPAGLCFLYVGRLAPEKRLEAFLDAFSRAIEENGRPRAFFAVVGCGPQEKSLRAAAAGKGLGERFRVHPPMRDVERAYAAADVFVLPSVSEGLSNALLEAMASGLAVLASRVGGTREAVREGISGLLFEPDGLDEMKAALSRFLREPGLAAELGRRAREDAASRYDIRLVAGMYKELYGDC